MSRARVWVRLGLLIGLIVAVFWIARRTLLHAYAGSEPIAISAEPAAVTFERAFPNLFFERPVFVTFPPDGSNRIAVISQTGSVYLFPNDPDVEEPSELLNIRQRVMYPDGSNEEGLLGLAFHPKFRENRQFFLYYTGNDHVNVLSRFKMAADDADRADPASEEEIFRAPQRDSWNHNGGTILFGPDGYLYVAVGDGGPVGDPHGNAQNVGTVLGKILRIDVDPERVDHDGVDHADIDREDQRPKYAVPNDNPFVGWEGARGEIWALGLRNVWRMAFDRQTNHLWAGDVGDDSWEEIDRIERGGNYGWNIKEGYQKFIAKSYPPPAPPPAHVVGKLIDPVFAYNHSIGNCIIGGCVYRGKQVPELFGAYLFADHVTGQVYALRCHEESGKAISVLRIQPAGMPVFSFGEDESGEVYFTTTQGIINRFVSARR